MLDPDAAIKFLRLMHPEGIWALSSLDEDKYYDYRSGTDEDAIRAFIAFHAKHALYFNVASVEAGLLKKAAKKQVLSARWLWVDIDPPDDADTGSALKAWQEETSAEFEVWQKESSEDRPTVLVFSGSGFQLYWRIEDTDLTNPEAQLDLEERMRGLGEGLLFLGKVDFSCCDVSRIMRLAGTINAKSSHEPALARVIWGDGPSHQLASFPRVAKSKSKPKTEGSSVTVAVPVATGDKRADAVAALAAAWPASGRHHASLALCGALAYMGWDVEDIAQFAHDVTEATGSDGEYHKRYKQAADSITNVESGGKVTGWPQLIEHLGSGASVEAAVDTAKRALGVKVLHSNWEELRTAILPPRDELAERRALNHNLTELDAAIKAVVQKRGGSEQVIAQRERLKQLKQGAPLEDSEQIGRIVRDVAMVAMRSPIKGLRDPEVIASACFSIGHPDVIRGWVKAILEVLSENRAGGDAELRSSLKQNEDGDIAPVSHNLTKILRESEALKDQLHFDLVTKKITITCEDIVAAEGTEVAALADHISEKWSVSFKDQLVSDRLGHVAKTHGHFDPLADYLNSLTWDGKARIGGGTRWGHRNRDDDYRSGDKPAAGWLVDYCFASSVDLDGSDVAGYVADVGAKWLISAVARGLEPGCKVDTALVLEGLQGRKKSGVFDVLGGEWFFDGKLDLGGDKDALQVIQSVWIVELAELASLARSGTGDQKAFLSKRKDLFRAPYDKVPLWWKRRCVFGGTVNPAVDGTVEYLRDDTGNRRWWAVRVIDDADVRRLAEDKDQLLAEAVHRYRRGERWWFTREEQEVADRVVAQRKEKSAWAPILKQWAALCVQGRAGLISGVPSDRWKLADIAKSALGIEYKDLNRQTPIITKALHEAGFQQAPRSVQRLWSHPEFSIPSAPTKDERHN